MEKIRVERLSGRATRVRSVCGRAKWELSGIQRELSGNSAGAKRELSTARTGRERVLVDPVAVEKEHRTSRVDALHARAHTRVHTQRCHQLTSVRAAMRGAMKGFRMQGSWLRARLVVTVSSVGFGSRVR